MSTKIVILFLKLLFATKNVKLTMRWTKQYLKLHKENIVIMLFEKLSIVKILYLNNNIIFENNIRMFCLFES